MKKNIFPGLAAPGLLLPYYFIFRFFSESGSSLPVVIQQAFANNRASAFAMDLILSIVVFWVLILAEAKGSPMKNSGLYLLATLFAGLSFAPPVFLYFRERKLEEQ